MKNIVWILLVLAGIGLYVNRLTDMKSKEDAKVAEANAIKQASKIAVSKMVMRTNAINDWESKLFNDGKIRRRSFLTIELEKLWVQDRPILFTGSIKDISTIDASHYRIILETRKWRLDSLELSLISRKPMIDKFIENNPDAVGRSLFSHDDIAVAATIESVRVIDVAEDGEVEQLRIGEGQLIEIMYAP